MFLFYLRKEALIAVQESIRIAQEANDSVCLQHALVLLLLLLFHIYDVFIQLSDNMISSVIIVKIELTRGSVFAGPLGYYQLLGFRVNLLLIFYRTSSCLSVYRCYSF